MNDVTKSEISERSKQGKYKPRVSTKMQAVIEIMAYEGLSLDLAAKQVGMEQRSARRAFKRPIVRAAFNALVKEVRENSAQQSFLRINHTSQRKTEDRLKFDANRFIAGVGGISPVQKVQAQHQVTHTFAGFTYNDE